MKRYPVEMGHFFSPTSGVGNLTSALHVFKRGRQRSPWTPIDPGEGHAPRVLESNPTGLTASNAALTKLPTSLLRHLATHGWDLSCSSFYPMLYLNIIKACFSWKKKKFMKFSLNDDCFLEMESKVLAIKEWSSELKSLVLTLPISILFIVAATVK